MINWYSTGRRDGIQVVGDLSAGIPLADDSAVHHGWTIIMKQPLTNEWNLYKNLERAGKPTDGLATADGKPAYPSSVSYREFVSQHTRLDLAMGAAEDVQNAIE